MTVVLEPRPTDELVCVAWVASIPGFSPEMVAVQLPPDTDGGSPPLPAPWAGPEGTGFCTVSVAGGNPDDLLPVHRPVMQLDFWAVVPGSGLPPWGLANALAEAVVFATWNRVNISRPLLIRLEGVTYPPAVVQGARVQTSPRRMWDDAGDMARYSMDLWLQWIAIGDRLD